MLKNILIKLKSFLHQSKRVLQLTKKPGKVEYLTIVKVSGIGILVIGAIGFVITMASQLILK
jgi:protein transport protein SEC61 subunit gamma-like protein|tara:strand:- start:267 stop:452 length:186 start_codon:yes stop_codon:yes gene_type:complete